MNQRTDMVAVMRCFLLLCLTLFGSLSAKQLDVSVSADGAILINAKTGAILYEKSPHEIMFPASTTKIATALTVLKSCGDKLDEKAKATREALASISPEAKKQSNYRSPPHWLETDGSHIGIKREEELPLRDLLTAILVGSANDAANVLAEHVGGTIPAFMERVNTVLKETGCLHTHFLNPHGLHHPDHVTTPYDLAIMTREAMKYPLFQQVVATKKAVLSQTNLEHERTLFQTNQLLRSGGYYYPKAIGVKTGTTSAAGKTLVAAAEEGERRLIGVVLGVKGKGRYEDMTAMFDAAFHEPKMRRRLLNAGPQTLTTKVPGGRGRLKTFLPDGLYYDFYPSEEMPVRSVVKWEIPALPIELGQRVGTITILSENGAVIKETPLLAAREMGPTLWNRFKTNLALHKRRIYTGGGVIVFLFFWAARKRRKKRRNHRPLF